jgi:hypothetical protein
MFIELFMVSFAYFTINPANDSFIKLHSQRMRGEAYIKTQKVERSNGTS